MKTLDLIKKDYIISKKNINWLENFNKNKFLQNPDDDILLSIEVEDILKESINKVDYKVNWIKQTTHEKLWFLVYVLLPMNKAKNYKNLIQVVFKTKLSSVIMNTVFNILK
ncbi:hypothetical protein AVT43_gp74 [Polaribacter phage P12002L]|uniref:Uncharacterized protein n=2 Tax=Incheonvirus TaxID=2976977 RepID=A0A0F7IK26_9CAUD|nr:hypothetical protein AVT42_gp76 [Polaribacter phage P12002S]YP_009209734.1 hypothetical protein AVT43_gp74 [Polaribacter phage P12002L]AKG94248.1 hypothetical protein P12002L_0074 [Polaribacter phage P12002L]AKG94332.1 hypothetical protein P12002S_0076 [Polaribacter phage P12002S]